MGQLNKDETNWMVAKLVPAPLDNPERCVEQAYESKEGKCNFCGQETRREFCSGKCETEAAFASIGKCLKFHE